MVVRIRLHLGAVVRGIDDGVRFSRRGEVGEDIGPREDERDEQAVVCGERGVGLEEEQARGAGEKAEEENLKLTGCQLAPGGLHSLGRRLHGSGHVR